MTKFALSIAAFWVLLSLLNRPWFYWRILWLLESLDSHFSHHHAPPGRKEEPVRPPLFKPRSV